MLQDSYLRWADVDLATARDTKAYLARLVTRQALNARRASARRREDYVGPWLRPRAHQRAGAWPERPLPTTTTRPRMDRAAGR